MATGSPFGPHRNAMDVDPEIRIREIRIFRNFFFASMDLLGPQGHPPDGPESPSPDPDPGNPENPDFSKKIFLLIFASTDPLGPQEHSPEVPVPPNPDPDREIRFFENPDFSFFRLFKLKDPTIWVSKLWGPESIHNIYNVPLEPERAAKARRAVVASYISND